jgi:hypothetical protein
MASAEVTRQREDPLITNPWPLLVTGFVTVAVGALLSTALKDSAPGLTALVVSAGTMLTAGAVVIRWNSALIWGLAALCASVGSVAFQEIGWDSGRLLFLVLMAAAGAGALLLLMPTTARWIVISVLLVIHFGGILTAVCSAAPGTWVASTLWNFFYRPHLQFMYLNNAYHFYSPEPGPAVLMWFCVHYEDDPGTKAPNWRWVKVPDFDEKGHPIRPDHRRLWPNTEYTRRLSMAESVNFPQYGDDSGFPLAARQNRRLRAGELHEPAIPPYPLEDMGLELQYRPANRLSMRWTAAYVRHVARTYRHEKKPELAVKSVQVYRVIHIIANARQIAEGWDPYDPIMYQPFYQGEYDRDGNTIHREFDEGGRPVPDPFLFWLIPILREYQREQETPPSGNPTRPLGPPKGKLTNYVYIHAGVPDEGELP